MPKKNTISSMAMSFSIAGKGHPTISSVRPFVVPVAEESVKQGYLKAGRPDAYNKNNIRYISDEQFAYTAGVNGIPI